MEDLLTPVKTAYTKPRGELDRSLVEVQNPVQGLPRSLLQPSTPEEALDVLRAEPDLERLSATLKYLIHDAPSTSEFQIRHPSPMAAQIINILVSHTLPNYWPVLKETSNGSSRTSSKNGLQRRLLLSCLRSISGLNAIVARLKALIQAAKETNKRDSRQNHMEILEDHLDLLENVLRGDTLILHLWNDLPAGAVAKQKALWHEVITVLAGGKLVSGAAEATSLVNDVSTQIRESVWVADGILYSRWLARNMIQWFHGTQKLPEGTWNPFRELFAKSIRLGYPETVLAEILALLLGEDKDRAEFRALLENLNSYEQRMVLDDALKTLSKRHLSISVTTDSMEWWRVDAELVAGAAAYLELIVSKDNIQRSHLISWLTSLSGAGVGEAIGIRRAAIAVLSDSKYDIELVLEKSLQQFGDQLYIKHAPSLQQEVHTQVLLLSAGYVHRNAPLKLAMLLRSSAYLNAVSIRLAASSIRARFLGMIVGEALSALVEKPEKRMNFKTEELENTEARWYKSLTGVRDTIGSISMLRKGKLLKNQSEKLKPRIDKGKTKPVTPQANTKIIAIQELDNYEPEDDGLVPYAKPDSDAEDSDEDPTLIQRNKPTTPVYIRDLIVFLRDTENYERQRLALATASSLIRRKANFGTEVSDHVEELATLLIGLQDKYDMENFQDMRLQGMIAVLLSQPSKMARWFSNTFFEGDYSIAQRASVLTVLSISARELAGFKEQDSSLTKLKPIPEHSFPSKLLPERLHKVYGPELQLQSPVDALSQQLSNTIIQPLAASLADKAAGPDVLKVRTFSSRLAIESRRKAPTSNALSTIVASSFFFPLTGRFFAHFKAYGSKNVIFEPYLLSSFLKTLSLILHASGLLTLQLPQMTSEMWDLLLSLRMQGQADRSIGEALLFAFMTLLEINEDKRSLAETHGKELLETQGWVEFLFTSMGTGTKEDDKMRALAAGVLFKIREIVEKYQALLIGDLSSF